MAHSTLKVAHKKLSLTVGYEGDVAMNFGQSAGGIYYQNAGLISDLFPNEDVGRPLCIYSTAWDSISDVIVPYIRYDEGIALMSKTNPKVNNYSRITLTIVCEGGGVTNRSCTYRTFSERRCA